MPAASCLTKNLKAILWDSFMTHNEKKKNPNQITLITEIHLLSGLRNLNCTASFSNKAGRVFYLAVSRSWPCSIHCTHYLAWFSCNDKHCRIKLIEVFLALRVILPGVLCVYSAFWELCQGTEVFFLFSKSNRSLYLCPCTPHVNGVEVGCHLTASSSQVHYLQGVAKLALYFCLTLKCSPAP